MLKKKLNISPKNKRQKRKLSNTLMSLIGGHVSAQGGFVKAMERAKDINANVVQLFGASPVRWSATIPTKEEAERFIKAKKEAGVELVFLHAPYLINLASPKTQLAAMSCSLLQKHLQINNALGADGVIFHIGSRGEQEQKEAQKKVIDAIKRILTEEKEGRLLIENSAGAGNLVGASLEEVGLIIREINDDRAGFCYDTAHGFEAGVLTDFSSVALNSFFKKMDVEIGLKKLWAIHLNDSKTPASSNKDRHENIGDGHIGQKSICSFVKHKTVTSIPLILEVPGINDSGPDRENIERVKKCFI